MRWDTEPCDSSATAGPLTMWFSLQATEQGGRYPTSMAWCPNFIWLQMQLVSLLPTHRQLLLAGWAKQGCFDLETMSHLILNSNTWTWAHAPLCRWVAAPVLPVCARLTRFDLIPHSSWLLLSVFCRPLCLCLFRGHEGRLQRQTFV